MFNLLTGALTEDHQRNQGQARGQRGHQDRRQSFSSPPHHQVTSERHALLTFQVLEVIDQQDPVPSGDAENGEESDQRAERHDSTAEEGCDDATNQGHRQSQEAQQGEAPAAEGGLQQQQDRGTGKHRSHQQYPLSRLSLLPFAEYLRVISLIKLDVLELFLKLPND